ncbi:gamma-glutamylcyclotransferase [Xylophilus ampelinus]|uniref:gamma-glutamylcyclotransferase n=1 Tax=Xylophilus ampelinus TaxID=54067 RepID=UPI001F175853|nr:gamma-glutamylcyclotransferase [Xylophilus ampelinus]
MALASTATSSPTALPEGAWERLQNLPPSLSGCLTPSEQKLVADTIGELRHHVEAGQLNFVPVFGHWSLRTDNHRVLGKASQADVVEGRDTLPASIKDYGMDFVSSTVFRGTPRHPGAVASITARIDDQVAGIVLKLPLARAEELLMGLLERELLSEADLRAVADVEGQPRSNLMYRPAVRPVVLDDGSTVHALVFETNPHGAKSLSRVFDDADGLTPPRLAYFMTAQGGFEHAGQRLGGSSLDYWRAGMQLLEKSGIRPPALLGEAYDIASTSESLPEPLEMMCGAATPRGSWHEQRDRLARAERSLPQVYTTLQAPEAQARHHQHQEAMDSALTRLRSSTPALQRQADGADFRDVVADALPQLLRDIGFQPEIYAAKSKETLGYGRYLLHSDTTPENNFCLQIFAFDPTQKTPIHNHPNECASFIALGQLRERLYDDGKNAVKRDDKRFVKKLVGNERPQSSWAGFNAQELDIPHSLKNKSDSLAVSVHLYRDMDGISGGAQVAAKDRFERMPSQEPEVVQ